MGAEGERVLAMTMNLTAQFLNDLHNIPSGDFVKKYIYKDQPTKLEVVTYLKGSNLLESLVDLDQEWLEGPVYLVKKANQWLVFEWFRGLPIHETTFSILEDAVLEKVGRILDSIWHAQR